MQQLNKAHHTLYRLLSCLSIILLLTGQGAKPSGQTNPPPTPAEKSYSDWTAHRPPQSAHTGQFEGEQLVLQGTCSYGPSKENYTALVFSSMRYANNYDEEIYYQSGLCSSGSEAQLTTVPGSDFEPRLNQNATKIVFTSNRNSRSSQEISNIYTMDTAGANQRQITSTSGLDRMPTFSPDGTKIAFVSNRAGNAEIYTMKSDGSSPVRLTNAPEPDVDPDWSPNGQQIAWMRRLANNTGVLYVMSPDGSNQRALLPPLPYASRPVWSPSGSRIAFHYDSNNDGWFELAVVNADGSGLNVLPIPKYDYQYIDLEMGGWLADESGLVYSRIDYVYYEGKWYINSAAIYLVKFNDLFINVVSQTPYSFAPHTRSLDDTPPVSTIEPLPEFSPASGITLNWTITDNYSQPYSFQLQASSDLKPDWQYLSGGSFDYVYSPIKRTTPYLGQPGTTAYFRIQAVDRANNTEPQKTTPDASTRIYQWMSKVNITDAREHPLNGVQVLADPAAMNQPVSKMDGEAALYFPVTGRFAVSYNKPGFAALPPQKWSISANTDFQTVLTGPEEQLQNGHFDHPQTPLAGWQSTGDLPTGDAEGRYSGRSARLGTQCSDVFCLSDPIQMGLGEDNWAPSMAVDPQGRIHVRYLGNHYGILDENGSLQPWPDLPVKDSFFAIKFDTNDAPYMLGGLKMLRWTGSAWAIETTPISAWSASYDMDDQGRLHVLYASMASDRGLFYTRREVNGTWQMPIRIISDDNHPADMAVEANGTAHIVYYSGPINYLQIKPDLTKTAPLVIHSPSSVAGISLYFFPNRGLVVVSTSQSGWWSMQRPINGDWTDIPIDSSLGWVEQVRQDAAGNVYALAENRESGTNALIDMRFSIKAAGEDHFHTYIIPAAISINGRFDIDLQGRPHFLYSVYVNSKSVYFYRHGVQTASAGTSALDQPITFTPQMHAPTLSFFYRVDSPNPSPQSRFQITFTPSGGQSILLFDQPVGTSDWAHAWADLSPYSGQTGSLSFRLVQNEGEFPSRVHLDEVSVSSWTTPLLTQISPNPLPYPLHDGTWIDLYGENLQSTAQVFLGEGEIETVEWISSSHIRILAPVDLPMGAYPVKIVNPSGADCQKTLHAGNFLYLPLLGR